MRLIDKDKLIENIKQAFKLNMEGAILSASDMVEAIEKAPTVDLWKYPSKGEYPPILEYVLCFMTDDTYEVGYYQGEIAGEPEWAFTCFLGDVIAWMPLPEPPKEEA